MSKKNVIGKIVGSIAFLVVCLLLGVSSVSLVEVKAAEVYDRESIPYESTKLKNLAPDYKWQGYENPDGTLTVVGVNGLGYELIIPPYLNGKKVTAVAGVFRRKDSWGDYYDPQFYPFVIRGMFTKIDLPDTVEVIAEDTFSEFTGVKTIVLPNNPELDVIDEYGDSEAFYDAFSCNSLETLTSRELVLNTPVWNVHEGVTKVKADGYNLDGKFKVDNKVTTINLPNTIGEVEITDFPNLTKLNSSKPLNQISFGSLRNCPKLHISITVNVAERDEWGGLLISFPYDYENSGITGITINDKGKTLKFLQKDTFLNCPSLKSINITKGLYFQSKDGVLYWKNDLMAYPTGKSTATNYNVPSDVQCIYAPAFDGSKFTSITFPENMNSSFYWDSWTSGYDESAGRWIPTSMFSYNKAKVRVINGSYACLNDSREELAARLEIPASRVEFYYGNTYKISYNLNGGTNASGNPTSYRAGEIKPIKTPTKAGSTFLGWKRNDDTTSYSNDTKGRGVFRDLTFTAMWKDSVKVNKISLTGISKQLAAGKKVTLKADVLPKTAANKEVTWKSSNKNIATVSSKGVVTIKPRTGGKKVTITATAKDGSKVKATYKITVSKGVVQKVNITGKKTLKAGKMLALKTKIKATKGANKKIQWETSNKKYATVTSKGKVKALKAGKGKTVTITARATDGSNKVAKFKIKIK